MAQSQNTTVEYTAKASCLMGLTTTGNLMLGDRAFEYYNDRNVEDYVQIPWDEVDHVSAEVLFNKIIPRFTVYTKKNGGFTFSTRDNKEALRAVAKHVPADRMRRAPSFFKVVSAGATSIPRTIKEVVKK